MIETEIQAWHEAFEFVVICGILGMCAPLIFVVPMLIEEFGEWRNRHRSNHAN